MRTTVGKAYLEFPEEFRVWAGIVQRCTNPNVDQWKDYGGRGITMCAEWRNSFETFLSDMGRRPSTKHTIERKDNNGNYCKDNCIWATREVQANNKRNNRRIEFNGETHTLMQWSKITGIDRNTIATRLNEGYTVEQALTLKSNKDSRLEAREARTTHCPQGHEYSAENTGYTHSRNHVERYCRQCKRAKTAEWQKNNREKINARRRLARSKDDHDKV